ncbi:175_t:CDS:1 [Ambispora leptoticha]|uniref:175_t:CDS:1 n=1 Tax=Ambispora leptoticha TaxID=144679 RepID=A0A9N9HJE1_9GLOM|nr:175_t:CDS:1 [Ambispora leptoticha]
MAITKTFSIFSEPTHNFQIYWIYDNPFSKASEISNNEEFDPETLYFKNFDGVYYEEPEEDHEKDDLSYESDCNSDISSATEYSIHSPDKSIPAHESDNVLLTYSRNTSISTCSLPIEDKESMEININASEKVLDMNPKDYYWASSVNFRQQKTYNIIKVDLYDSSK